MSERRYFVLCADNCRFEAMSKEQILSAIMQAVNEGTVGDIDAGVVSAIVEQNKNGNLSFWVGTEAEYNALGVKSDPVMCRIGEDGKLYICEGNSGGAITQEYRVTVPASAWKKVHNMNLPEEYIEAGCGNEYWAQIEVLGVLGTDTPFVDVEMPGSYLGMYIKQRLEAWSYVDFVQCEDNLIILISQDGAPTTDLPIIIKVVR